MDITEQRFREILREELQQATALTQEQAPLSEEAAAAFLGGIEPKTLARLALNKRIAYLQLGRKRVYPIAGLRQYIDDHTIKTEPNPWGLTDSGLKTLRSGRARRTP